MSCQLCSVLSLASPSSRPALTPLFSAKLVSIAKLMAAAEEEDAPGGERDTILFPGGKQCVECRNMDENAFYIGSAVLFDECELKE